MHADHIRETIASACDEIERELYERQIALACRDLLLLVRQRMETDDQPTSVDTAFDVAALGFAAPERDEEGEAEPVQRDDVALPYIIVFDTSRN